MSRLVVVSTRCADLPEQGEAILVDEQANILARFVDGNIEHAVTEIPVKFRNSDEPTLTPVA